jgi:omega-6 fatty acid desaturase (delta-12 desaturase)
MFHDCCHGSFLRSRRGTRIIGTILGVLTFTPFGDWRHAHGIHHSSSGNLDRRGVGDIWTMTVREYQRSSKRERMQYRLFRHPLVMFGLGPIYTFLIRNRFPGSYATKAERANLALTNGAILAIAAAASLTIGIVPYLLIQLPVVVIAGVGGIWLFYVQHQFDPSYWARDEEWESVAAALHGSSHYRLPPVLQWLSGNIGLHHIHHLLPRIPNYRLQQCLEAIPELQLERPLTIARSIRSVRLNLWDEANGELVSFAEVARQDRRSGDGLGGNTA